MPEKTINEMTDVNVDGHSFVPNINAAVFVPSWLQDSASSSGATDQANGVKDKPSPASEPPIDDWEEAAESVPKQEPRPTNEDNSTTPGTPEEPSEGTQNDDSGSQDDDISAEEPKKQFNEAGNRTKKEHVNIVFIGHVDAGKSTIGGQILFLTGQVDKRTLEKYEKEAKEKNRESWYLSWALDTNLEERDKGKTVEVGRASFETDSKHFTILDAPGHKSFVPNMIGGASQADLAVLVISARKGEFETGFERGGQTREHAMLAKTAGVKHLMVLINKMDDPTVNWSEARYNECKEKLMPYLKKVGFNPQKDVTFMPASGLTGAGLKEPVGTDVCPWYSGPTFLNFIEEMAPISRMEDAPFVMPIVDRYKDMGTVVLGKVEAGTAKLGTKLIVMPNKSQVVVDQLWSDDDEVQEVAPGENVRIKLKGVEEEDISPGFVLCDPSNTCKTGRIFDAQVNLRNINLKILITI
ncbi:hypothetical protein QYM36_008654 [Artemia franciscana]|uniref:Tr-type G domain-containing protein n=1 Tax=Artemia franciscana TaxID=6661 RepID=A0AA88HRX9_ARTSF|nr:hypothetical protein QYM36_008654 [Artemia franciscana]